MCIRDGNVGRHDRPLVSGDEGRLVRETALAVCATGRMTWQATVMLEIGRKDISVPYRFEGGQE